MLSVDETTKIEDALLKRVEIQLDYIEFEDSTTLGPDLAGSRIIKSMRDGASMFKKWLVAQFRLKNNSVEAIIPSLRRDSNLPAELRSTDIYTRQGAQIYRSHLLKVFDSSGSDSVARILKNGV